MTLQVTDVDAFVRWVLRFGSHAVVVSPAWVRKRVMSEVQTVGALYAPPSGARKRNARK